MAIQNFYDVYLEHERKKYAGTGIKRLVKNSINSISAKPTTASDKVNITPFVGNDLLVCAGRRNGILTEFDYKDEGKYTLVDVKNCFGSFAQACAQLKIINPANVEDKAMILKDIKGVFEYVRKIDETTYREYGAYSYADIDRRWSFKRLLVEAGFSGLGILYPIYPVKRLPQPIKLIWVHTRNKRFYGV